MGLLEYRDFGLSGESDEICIDLIEGYQLPITVRGKDWIVPRLDGRQEGNRRADLMVIPLAGVVKGIGIDPVERREAFNLNVTALMAIMDPTLGSGTLKLSDGYLGLPVGSEAMIEARVKNAAPGKIQSYRVAIQQLWTFELEALDPVWDLGS